MGKMLGLKYEVDPADYMYALDTFATVERHRKQGVPPMQEYTEKSKPCTQCPWAKTCWGRGS